MKQGEVCAKVDVCVCGGGGGETSFMWKDTMRYTVHCSFPDLSMSAVSLCMNAKIAVLLKKNLTGAEIPDT